MNDILKNKHVLGGLTLRDLKEKVESLRVWSVEIEGSLYERFVFHGDTLDLWEIDERYIDNEPADRAIDLDTPVKVRDGNVILLDDISGIEETIVFGTTAFVPTRIEILEGTRMRRNR